MHGGQQPVVGAQIQLYAAGSPTIGGGGDYGQGSTPLITGDLPTTDANGRFSITGTYELPGTPSYFYIVATGGSPGNGNPSNPNIALMATIGRCVAMSELSPTLFIDINEVTTIASVTALQQFLEAPSSANVGTPHFGAPSIRYNDLRTAFANATNMVAMANEAKLAQPGSTGLRINTLADILAFCVNSDPITSENCATLYTYAEPSSEQVPGDTIQAAWYIAQSPTNNVSQLFALVPPSPPFIALPEMPLDFDVSPPPTAEVGCIAAAANATITNASLGTVVSGGDVTVYPGTAITGFPPGLITSPAARHVNDPNDPVAQGAFQASIDAYVYLNSLTGAPPSAPLGSMPLPPGIYQLSTVSLSGTLVLDAGGDPNALFIFQIGSTLIVSPNAEVVLTGGAKASNVFWQVGSSATLGQNCNLAGTILAVSSITMVNGAHLNGRVFAISGALTLDNNTVTSP